MELSSRTRFIIVGIFALCAVLVYELTPVSLFSGTDGTRIFEIKGGDGFRAIAQNLSDAGLIRSKIVFEGYAFLAGDARSLHPGLYRLNPGMSVPMILQQFAALDGQEISVTVPEGSNLYQIDNLLSNALVVPRGAFSTYAIQANLEGRLFPDTYQFLPGESLPDIVKTFTDTFAGRTAGILPDDLSSANRTLILASILEKEVPDDSDRKIVAGILEKRLADGIPLDVDATVCYAKQIANPNDSIDCASLTANDFKIASPYNTYLHKGLPPGPIGNPGIDALKDVLEAQTSPYLYYLSDPKTGKTIYAETLQEQENNQKKYLSP